MFTDPEIAWTGLTEHEAEQGRAVNVGRFPLTAHLLPPRPRKP